MEGRKEEGWKEGQMMTEGREDLVGQDKRDKLTLVCVSLDSTGYSKCQNTPRLF